MSPVTHQLVRSSGRLRDAYLRRGNWFDPPLPKCWERCCHEMHVEDNKYVEMCLWPAGEAYSAPLAPNLGLGRGKGSEGKGLGGKGRGGRGKGEGKGRRGTGRGGCEGKLEQGRRLAKADPRCVFNEINTCETVSMHK